MAAYYPIFMGPPPHTAVASATITGGQVIEVSATGTVGPAAAASAAVVGVAGFDVTANQEVVVFRGGIQELVANGTVTAGQQVETAAAGQVRTLAAGRAVGVAMTTATNGNKVQVAFNA
jgi:hypothetical protein